MTSKKYTLTYLANQLQRRLKRRRFGVKIIEADDDEMRKDIAIFSAVGHGSSMFDKDEQPAGSSEVRAAPYPFYLAPYTSTTCCGKLDDIVKALDDHFAASSNVDVVSFHSTGCVWKTQSYYMQHCLSASVHIFESEDGVDDKFIVQVQRVRGCAFQFAAFFKSVKEGLVSRQLCNCECTGASDPQVPMRKTRAASAEDVMDFRPIVDMARSPFADVQEQALLLIAAEASKLCPITQAVLATTPLLLETIVELLDSPHADIHRCAAAALYGLSNGDDATREKIAAMNGIGKLVKLGETRGICKETARQVAAALVELRTFARDENTQTRIRNILMSAA